MSDGPGRLLNYDVDQWVHLNCALWHEDVFEMVNGALMNVDVALRHSRSQVCVHCNRAGASVKCFKLRCSSVFHLGCAVKDGCIFLKNKSAYCSQHPPKTADMKEDQLTTLSVFRRVYINRDENRQVATVMHHHGPVAASSSPCATTATVTIVEDSSETIKLESGVKQQPQIKKDPGREEKDDDEKKRRRRSRFLATEGPSSLAGVSLDEEDDDDDDKSYLLRVGSLTFASVGQLLPHQLAAFHSAQYIYPIGYRIVRFYWSPRVAQKRCRFVCSIEECQQRPRFVVQVQEPADRNLPDLTYKDWTCQGVWQQVLQAIEELRRKAGLVRLFPQFLNGEDLFGLNEPAIVRVLESMPGIETLSDYHFKYGRNPLLELPLAINPTGSARSEPKLRTHFKRVHHAQRTVSCLNNQVSCLHQLNKLIYISCS